MFLYGTYQFADVISPVLRTWLTAGTVASAAGLLISGVSLLERRFPQRFANDGDSCGLTIGCLREVERGGAAVIVLCVDLTEQVLAEAVASHADHIICYAPAISPEQPLRKVSVHDPTGRVVLKCAQEGMAVHSIHTACANAPNGLLDWMAESLAEGTCTPIHPRAEEPRAGEGRLLECSRALPLSAVIARLKELLGVRHLRLALGVVVDEPNLTKAQECCFVKTVAIAVGEGAHVLRDTLANVFVTSEMSHSEVLAANARGVVVLLLGRTTMERAFLAHLRDELQEEWADSDWNVKVKCSGQDCNPLAIV